MCRSSYPPSVFVLGLLLLASGCDRNAAEMKRLHEENQRLRSEVEQLKRGPSETKAPSEPGTAVKPPDFDLTINDLWTQRFDDNEFRARQRLANKILRVTGVVDDVTDTAITLQGASKRFGHIRMTVTLSAAYAGKVGSGLEALEQGIPVTVQGKFAYDRTSLSDAVFVDANSGKTLSSGDLATLTLSGGASRPSPSPEK